ncbi:MAG TPA: hypothetical protein VEW25_04455 [Allosphingosinicella sp.]|nr:hypothetical protein [Allosphingosinicella sp.]
MLITVPAKDLREREGPAIAPADERAPLRAPHHVVDGFLPAQLARDMRAAIDAHFAEPYRQGAEPFQVWNYWYVPNLYTYLRTRPDKVIPRALVDRFYAALTAWSWNMLGMGRVTFPYLSLYIPGCAQAFHNDSKNGRFGFVYSLTHDARDTRGGETLVMREGDLFRDNLATAQAGPGGFYDSIAPAFNRLTIFDDRMPHAVQRLEGSMDPREGRFVLHGHLSETGPGTRGALTPAEVGAVVETAANEALDARPMSADPHGPVVVRLAIAASGEVETARLVLDRAAFGDGSSAEGLADAIVEAAAALRFPERDGPTEAIVPILLGGPLPLARKA